MSKKAYIIIHDGSNVLVGEGGCSGINRRVRAGYHLPGGSINENESMLENISRELSEETGININQLKIEDEAIKNNELPDITFVVAKADNINYLVAKFQRPAIINKYDEPYERLISIKSANCWNNDNFSQKYYTDWFSYGLFAAKKYIAP